MTHNEVIEMLEAEWRDRLKAAVLAEREACAKVCDGYSDGRHANMADLCAEAIRARGNHD